MAALEVLSLQTHVIQTQNNVSGMTGEGQSALGSWQQEATSADGMLQDQHGVGVAP